MKKTVGGILGAAAILFSVIMSAGTTWAAGSFTEHEGGQFSYVDEQGQAAVGKWIYEEESRQWYYLNQKGFRVTGKIELYGSTYFFDKDGRMLTGWVSCPEGDMPETYTGTIDGKDIYFCESDGRMATGWVTALSPEITADMRMEGYAANRYCFSPYGKIYRNEQKTIDGKRYNFQADATCLSGWIYDYGDGAEPRFLKVNTDSSEADKNLCRENPEKLMFGLTDDCSLAAGRWVDALPAWDNEGDDVRSFYMAASGYLVTPDSKNSGSMVCITRKTAVKIEEPGTYILASWSTDVGVMKINEAVYCMENSGARLDGIMYLSGEDGTKFPDGIYCFTDNSSMKTGAVMEESEDGDGYIYYYYFSEKTDRDEFKGQGVTGVKAGRLYYQGLAVGAQEDSYEVVYVPALAERDARGLGTGLFLVDSSGRIGKGTKAGIIYQSSDGNEYRVRKEYDGNETYGYLIDSCDGEKDGNGHKVWKQVTELNYDEICWNAVEE